MGGIRQRGVASLGGDIGASAACAGARRAHVSASARLGGTRAHRSGAGGCPQATGRGAALSTLGRLCPRGARGGRAGRGRMAHRARRPLSGVSAPPSWRAGVGGEAPASRGMERWGDVTLPSGHLCAFRATEHVRIDPLAPDDGDATAASLLRWELSAAPEELGLPRPLAALCAKSLAWHVRETLESLASHLAANERP